MPFTPFHFGPALLIKSAEKKFSFLIFVFSQVVMDLEPLYFILKNDPPLHRLFHTLSGCHIVILISVLAGKPACDLWLKMCTSLGFSKGIKITWPAAVVSAFIGCYSHIFLDGLMHRDMRPLAPFSDANPWLQMISVRQLHWACLASGALGLFFMLISLKPFGSSKRLIL